MAKAKNKEKKGFKIPHLLYIMLGLLFFMSLMTYIIPAGNFGVDEAGKVNANAFEFLGHQTPVSPLSLIFMFLGGLTTAGVTVWIVMVSGANMNVVMSTGAIDEVLEYATVKLKKSSTKVLVPVLYFLILYLAAFASTDALIAVVPIGVLFAKRLKLDPVSALAVSFFPSMIGFGLGITIRAITPQVMFDLPPLSGIGARFILLNIFGLVGLFFTMNYVKKVEKDPANSIMPNQDWKKEWLEDNEFENVSDEDLKFPTRPALVLALLAIQYIALVAYFFIVKERPMEFIVGFFIITSIIIGAVGGLSADEIANSFAKGLADMAFVVFIIGLATTMQSIMREGNIIDTIIYTLTRPLMGLDNSLSAIGIVLVIAIINPLIPSVMAKAAALVPILIPLGNALDIHMQVVCQAFLFGDSFTNMISPALGWTMGALAIANVPFDRWVRWVMKPMILFTLMSLVAIYILNTLGWTGM